MPGMTMGKSQYSLVELLAVMVVGAIVVGSALGFFYKGRGACMAYSGKAMAVKETGVLKNAFRQFVHESGEIFLVVPSKAVFKSGAEISFDEGSLVLESHGLRRSYALPRRAVPSLALERSPQGPCAVLRIDFEKGQGQGAPGLDFIRIAAAASVAEGGRDAKGE